MSFGFLLKELTAPIRSAIGANVGRLPGLGGSLSKYGKPYELIAREAVTRDTHRFRFALETPTSVLGLPVGHHVELFLPDQKGESRLYTPVTGNETTGSFDLVVKLYANGKAGKYLSSLKVGDQVRIAGPKGEKTYKGDGNFEIEDPFDNSKTAVQCRTVCMVGGGSGITPLYQIAAHVTKQNDPLEMSLLFANKTPQDVMLRAELDELASCNPAFHVTYAVDQDAFFPDAFPRQVGQVSAEMISQALQQLPAAPDLVFTCGPAKFQEHVKEALTNDLGLSHDIVVEF